MASQDLGKGCSVTGPSVATPVFTLPSQSPYPAKACAVPQLPHQGLDQDNPSPSSDQNLSCGGCVSKLSKQTLPALGVPPTGLSLPS